MSNDSFRERDLTLARSLAEELDLGGAYEDYHRNLELTLAVSGTHTQVEHRQAVIENNLANDRLIRSVTDLLPHVSGEENLRNSLNMLGTYKTVRDLGTFRLRGEYQAYTARQIQANVMWVPYDVGSDVNIKHFLLPYFIAGRKPIEPGNDDDAAELLLFPAAGHYNESAVSAGNVPWACVVKLRKDDFRVWYDTVHSNLLNGFTEHEAKQVVSSSGDVTINSESPGSFVIRRPSRKLAAASEKTIGDCGVRLARNKRKSIFFYPRQYMNDYTLEKFNVHQTLADMVRVFKLTDQIRTVLMGESEQPIPEQQENPVLSGENERVEALARQADNLRDALTRSLVRSSGFLTPQEAAKIVLEKFPKLH